MPVHVLYQIPFATGPIRMVIGGACLVFVLAIFGSWLPRTIRWLRQLPRESVAQMAMVMALALVPLAIGFAPLLVLIAVIQNPMAYVTDVGVTKDGVLLKAPVSLIWGEIAHVSCRAGRGSGPRRVSLIAADGRKIEFGDPGGVDFGPLRVYLKDKLGPAVMQGCP